MVSRTSKLILINAVKHSEAHNRRQEEKDMWQQRRSEVEEKGERSHRRHRDRAGRSSKYHKGDIYHSFKHGGFLEPSKDGPSPSRVTSSGDTSNKWAAELMRYEESLGEERWGHGGYKELYPEEFNAVRERPRSPSISSGEPEYRSKEKKLKKRKRRRKECEEDDVINEGAQPPENTISDSESIDQSQRSKRRHKHSDSEDSNQDTKKHKRHKKHKRKKSKRER